MDIDCVFVLRKKLLCVEQLAMLMSEAEALEAQKLKGAETSGGPSRLVHGSGSRSRRGT